MSVLCSFITADTSWCDCTTSQRSFPSVEPAVVYAIWSYEYCAVNTGFCVTAWFLSWTCGWGGVAGAFVNCLNIRGTLPDHCPLWPRHFFVVFHFFKLLFSCVWVLCQAVVMYAIPVSPEC